MNTKDDYIYTYNDTDRHGLASGITAAVFFIASCACLFGDIEFYLAALCLSLIGFLTGLYGKWQSKFNTKNRFPHRLCLTATILNGLFFAGLIVVLIIAVIGLCVTGGR